MSNRFETLEALLAQIEEIALVTEYRVLDYAIQGSDNQVYIFHCVIDLENLDYLQFYTVYETGLNLLLIADDDLIYDYNEGWTGTEWLEMANVSIDKIAACVKLATIDANRI